MASNLPATATALGGAVVEVLQWHQHRHLPAVTVRALGLLVAAHPELNTESRIDLLADTAGFHGERFDRMLVELFEDYDVEVVYLAIDTLYEAGLRSHQDAADNDRSHLECLADFVVVLHRRGIEPTTVTELVYHVEQCGGFESILHLPPSELDDRLDDDDSRLIRGGSVKSALNVLGVPSELVTRAREQGNLALLAPVVKAFYRALAQVYHPDTPTGDAELMAELTAAYEELQDPVGLEVAVDFYVGRGDQLQVDSSQQRRQQALWEGRRQESLRRLLVNTDQLAVLGSEVPARFVAALDLAPLDASPGRQPYFEALTGEVWPHELVLHQADRGDVVTALLTGGDAYFDGRPVYDREKAAWYDFVATEDMRGHQSYHDQLEPIPGQIRMVGGVRPAAALEVLRSLRGEAAVRRWFLAQASKRIEKLEWAEFDHAWWAPALRPQATPGDMLVLMKMGGARPLFALTGRLMAVEPL